MSSDLPPPALIDDPAFLEALKKRLRRLAKRYAHAGCDATDLVSEVWLRMRKAPPNQAQSDVTTYQERLLMYAHSVARNFLIDALRRRTPVTNQDLTRATGREPHEPFDGLSRVDKDNPEEFWRVVQRATEQVPVPPPEAFVRAWFEAQISGEPLTADRTKLWQAQFRVSRAAVYAWRQKVETVVRRHVALDPLGVRP